MKFRTWAPSVLPFLPLLLGLVLGILILRGRTVALVFQRDGRAFRAGDERWRPLPATFTLHDVGQLRLRVVNRDTRAHAVGALSVDAGDSVEVQADVCTSAWRGGDLVVLVQ